MLTILFDFAYWAREAHIENVTIFYQKNVKKKIKKSLPIISSLKLPPVGNLMLTFL
jgi:hypothetical protein